MSSGPNNPEENAKLWFGVQLEVCSLLCVCVSVFAHFSDAVV